MERLKIRMRINFAKFSAYTIILLGSLVSLIIKDGMVFISAVGTAAAIIANRDLQDYKKLKKGATQ